jgi:hypothetical protein
VVHGVVVGVVVGEVKAAVAVAEGNMLRVLKVGMVVR